MSIAQISPIDRLVLHSLKTELSLSQLSVVFSRGPLLRALERLVDSGKVACDYDGAEFRYRAL